MPEAAAAATPAARPLSPVLRLTLIFALVHLILAVVIPLVEDEAYYALWATVPSAGYYDHPPMIAWWIAAGEALFGPTRLGVRLLATLGYAAVTPLVARIALLASGEPRLAFRAALFYNATALILAMGFIATPDAPSTFFWALTAWALAEALAAPRSQGWWLVAGLASGLGVLSKFTNLFLWVGLALWLLASRAGRAQLGRRATWAGAGLALAVLVPFAAWNLAHHGAGLTRQFSRLGGAAEAPSLAGLAIFLATTAVLVTPLIAAAALQGARRPGPARLQLWLGAPLLAYMSFHALHSSIQLNWMAPLFPGAAVLAALGSRRWPARRTAAAAGLGLALGTLYLALAFWPGPPVFPGRNPANETKGWPAFRAELTAEMARSGARWIATDAYGLTGALSWELPDTPVWSITGADRYIFRGPLPAALCDAPGLLVTAGKPAASSLARFAQHGSPAPLARRAGQAVLLSYTATPVRGLAPCATLP